MTIKYRIWSFEHSAWWKGNKHGYTNDINNAGLFTVYQANAICLDANKLADSIIGINEVMVPMESEDK